MSLPFLARSRTPDLTGRAALAQRDVARPYVHAAGEPANTVDVTFPTPTP